MGRVKIIIRRKIYEIFYFINIRQAILTFGQKGRQYDGHTTSPKLNRPIVCGFMSQKGRNFKVEFGCLHLEETGDIKKEKPLTLS